MATRIDFEKRVDGFVEKTIRLCHKTIQEVDQAGRNRTLTVGYLKQVLKGMGADETEIREMHTRFVQGVQSRLAGKGITTDTEKDPNRDNPIIWLHIPPTDSYDSVSAEIKAPSSAGSSVQVIGIPKQ